MLTGNKKKIHFVGIGGIGMSGIARVLAEAGYSVSGSDLETNSITEKLEALGCSISEGHRASNLPKGASFLVYSSSISKDNPEVKEARKRGVRIIHRAQMLGELFNDKEGIAVTGTHGKTTTTSLISVMFYNMGFDPTVVIGGEVDEFKSNAKFGKGKYAVVEADESDSSFLYLKPRYAVLTNIEMEHIDHLKTMAEAKAAYRSFIGNIKDGGKVFYNYDDARIMDVIEDFAGRCESFGLSKKADIYAVGIKMDGFSTSFRCIYKGRFLGDVHLKIPGKHNVMNALAAILVGLNLGFDFKGIAASIKNFNGAKRRFQLRIERGGVMLIDDYAHHPTEIKAVLAACRNWRDKRIVVVFQPHRYTRTKFLAGEFGRCFNGADKVILTDIYAASEKPIKGVSIRNIYDMVKASGIADVEVVKKENIPDYIMKIKKSGDMILVLGAGNIKKTADELCERMGGCFTAREFVKELKDRIKGNMAIGENIMPHTSFKIGGKADIWLEPKDGRELKKAVLLAKKHKVPLFIMGNGSNVLASDDGFRGVVVHLGSPFFKRLNISGQTVHVGAGFSLPRLVRVCCDRSLGGLESLVGIPGTIGGAIYMNAGGYVNPIYKNIGDIVSYLKVMDYNGNVKILKKRALAFGYRHSNLAPYIILEAALKLEKGDRKLLTSSCVTFLKMKAQKQVLDLPSAGCIFKNPPDSQFTCGQMIDMLGLKGKRIGGAEISTKHANFIVNRKEATCKDVVALVELVKDKIKANYNIPLELEIKML